jgi:hypothetical protein
MTDRLMRVALTVLVLGFTVHCNGITGDEFHCEAAMAHLAECCPNFPLHQMTCESVPDGCGYSLSSQIDVEEADCLRQRSCDDIVADGLCDVVPTLPVTTDDSSRQAVCP